MHTQAQQVPEPISAKGRAQTTSGGFSTGLHMEDLYQFVINACSLDWECKTEKLLCNIRTTFNNAYCKYQEQAKPYAYYTLAFHTQVQVKDEDSPKTLCFCRDF